jgi:hypothetical protein
VIHRSGRDFPWRRLEDFDLAHDLDNAEILALHLVRAKGVEIEGGSIRQTRGRRITGAIDRRGGLAPSSRYRRIRPGRPNSLLDR